MADQSPPSPDETGQPERDPRLEIPEVLRTPVRKPEYDPVTGSRKSRKEVVDASGIGRAWAMSLDFVFTVLAGALLGWLIDRWRNSLPIGTLIGLGIGFVSGFIRLIRTTQRQERQEREQREARRRSQDGPPPATGA